MPVRRISKKSGWKKTCDAVLYGTRNKESNRNSVAQSDSDSLHFGRGPRTARASDRAGGETRVRSDSDILSGRGASADSIRPLPHGLRGRTHAGHEWLRISR